MSIDEGLGRHLEKGGGDAFWLIQKTLASCGFGDGRVFPDPPEFDADRLFKAPWEENQLRREYEKSPTGYHP